jgi:hypothetical protein
VYTECVIICLVFNLTFKYHRKSQNICMLSYNSNFSLKLDYAVKPALVTISIKQ